MTTGLLKNNKARSESAGPAQAGGQPLADKSLFCNQAYLNGCWVDADHGGTIDVADPATGKVIGSVPDMGAAETERAIAGAAAAFTKWRALTAAQRGSYLRAWADLMRKHRDDLARIMTLEQGKPLAESIGEINYSAAFLDWFGEEGQRQYGDVIPTHLPGSRLVAWREPVGVTAAITPWNFPSAMITRKAGAALAAGCTMIVRPANETPFSALALARLAERAGIPAGVFSVVTGSARSIAKTLTDSPVIRKISFTGSTEVGRILLEQSAATVKKVSMELGGHAPFILFADGDIDHAVKGAIIAKFTTTGQDCLAANRIFVHRSQYAEFCERFAKATAALKVGNGFEPGADQGPLMNEAALHKCEEHIADAIAKGGKILAGGKRHELGGLFFEPTVIAGLTTDMKIFHEETFGPVAPIMAFDTEEEVTLLANDTIYGLAAYLYTRDIGCAWRVAEALEYGMIGLNTPKMTGAPIPFGGVKQSGLGREGSRHGLDDYSEIKYFCIGAINERA